MDTPQQQKQQQSRYIKVDLGDRVGEKSYRVEFDFNAVSDLEDAAGCGLGELLANRKMNFQGTRLLIFFGCRAHDRSMNIRKAGNIMKAWVDAGGTFEDLNDILLLGLEDAGIISISQAAADDDGEGGGGNARADQD